MSDLEIAARTLLDAHDALRAHDKIEPASDPDTDLPYDREGWLDWYEVRKAYYAAWRKAMDDFSRVYGLTVADHPWTFRPLAKAVLAGTLTDELRAHPLRFYAGKWHWTGRTEDT